MTKIGQSICDSRVERLSINYRNTGFLLGLSTYLGRLHENERALSIATCDIHVNVRPMPRRRGNNFHRTARNKWLRFVRVRMGLISWDLLNVSVPIVPIFPVSSRRTQRADDDGEALARPLHKPSLI